MVLRTLWFTKFEKPIFLFFGFFLQLKQPTIGRAFRLLVEGMLPLVAEFFFLTAWSWGRWVSISSTSERCNENINKVNCRERRRSIKIGLEVILAAKIFKLERLPEFLLCFSSEARKFCNRDYQQRQNISKVSFQS